MNTMTRPIAAALAALALAGSAVPNASLKKTETNAKAEGTVVDSVSDDIRRPVPTEFETGKDYEDLLFYEYSEKQNEDVFANLPAAEKVSDESGFINAAKSAADDDTMHIEVESVQSDKYTDIVRFEFAKENDQPYNIRFNFSVPIEEANDGDAMLAHIYVNGYNRDIYLDKPAFQAQLAFKDENGKKIGSARGEMADTRKWGREATEYYVPFTYKSGTKSVDVTFGITGRYGQKFIAAGFEILSYGKNVSVEELPNGVSSMSSLKKEATWRKEAWERIEEIRKGDMNVTVVDKNGKPVKEANVDVNMYEHEFSIGSATTTAVIEEDYSSHDKYTEAFAVNFNSAVQDNFTKWGAYERYPEKTHAIFDALRAVGVDTFRGHVLEWDMEYNPAYWDVFPDDLPSLFDDRDAYQKRVREHIAAICGDLAEYTKEWDVLNEAVEQKYLQKKYGRGLIKEWFDMAREALGEDGVLYYNDFDRTHELFELLDEMTEMGVDFDGIGFQSHIGDSDGTGIGVRSVEQAYDFYDQFYERYGKRQKITEYTLNIIDEALQANYTRDFIIAAFSHESIDGFLLWEFWNGINGEADSVQYIFYNSDWSPRLALNVWQDLFYNKWWTRESLKTDENGKVSLRVFYGDYDVTVTTADGKTKTVSIPLHKGEESDFIIVID